jgi:SNF2 family DNA or RNA helicase
MSRNQSKKIKNNGKEANILPTPPPIIVWNVPTPYMSKKFLSNSFESNENIINSESADKIVGSKSYKIKPEDLVPFDFNTIKDSITGNNFIDSERTIPHTTFDDFNRTKIHGETMKKHIKLLDHNSQKIPANISGIYTTLTKYQCTSVAAMMEIEDKKYSEFVTYDGKKGLVNINAGVFSDEVGTGKTLTAATLIRIKPYPGNSNPKSDNYKPAYDLKPIYVDNMSILTNAHKKDDDTGYRGFIKRRYKKILRPTIVFAGVSVTKQWCSEVETFTNFKYLEVIDVRGVDNLMTLISNGKIDNYDLVIVKNGIVTRDVQLPGNLIKEDKNRTNTPYIYNLIGNLRNITWARCFIDDFDSIQLPSNASIPNACFTWYISSTNKYLPNNIIHNNQFTKTSDALIYENVSCGSIMRNQFLFTMFNVRNHSDFVKANNGLTNPLFYVGVFKDTNDGFTKLIGSFSNEETAELVQMLNSGSINTAAEKAGVATKSAADIFETILGKNYNLYKRSVSVLKFIEQNYEDDSRLPANEIPTDEKNPDHHYTKENLLNCKVPEYKYPNLRQLMRDTKEEQEKIYKATDSALKRVKENIKSGNCPICTESINEIDGNIMICRKCSVTGCEDCIILACEFHPVDNMIKGMCPMCRKEINISDMIHVSKDIELIDIVNDNFEKKTAVVKKTETSETIEESKGIDIHDTDDPEKRTKITALIDVINGKIPIEFKQAKIKLNQLQAGADEIQENKLSYRKILVFTSYEESIDNISKALNLRNISFWRLAGTAANINQISHKFNSHEGNAVLIINSSKHCAGLNLQTADWLIYFHKVLDENVETQIAGRGQRLGRSSTLKIAYLLHKNEIEHINFV